MDRTLAGEEWALRRAFRQPLLLRTPVQTERWRSWREEVHSRQLAGERVGPFAYKPLPHDPARTADRLRASLVDVARGDGEWIISFEATNGVRFGLRLKDGMWDDADLVAIDVDEWSYGYYPEDLDGKQIGFA
jgi:hypothetical protein